MSNRTPERDIYEVGTLINGLPTCVFPSAGYSRIITNLLVKNSAPGPVNVYRGLLGSVPIASNLLGSNNTLGGDLKWPAGQTLYVQWAAVGASASDATARISSERNDNPFEEGVSGGSNWSTTAIDSLTIPNTAGPNDPQILIGSQIPPDLQAFYSGLGTPDPVVSVIIEGIPDALYHYEAVLTSGAHVSGNVNAVGVPGTRVQEMWKTSWTAFEADVLVGFNGLANMIFGFATLNMSNQSNLLVDGSFLIDGRSAARGLVDRVSSIATAGPAGAEAVAMNSNAIVWKAGRAYEVLVFNPAMVGSIASNQALWRIRRNNLAGANLTDAIGVDMSVGAGRGTSMYFRVIIVNAGGVDVTDNLALTLEAFGGGTVSSVGSAIRVRYMEVRDVGAATDYPNAVQI